jgi:peptidoglycan/xylan/chitin deacetylase (PgdA/CDA1 family)
MNRREWMWRIGGGLIAAAMPGATAMAEEPDRRIEASSEISAIQAAEAESRIARTTPGAVEVPIVMYHHVVPDHAPGVLFVTPDLFEQQLIYLRDNGYRSISFDDLADSLELGLPLPERPVILSFDDGWENQYRYGFPLLQKYGFTGTFYVVTNYLDHQNFMTTDALKTMMAAGMTIGAHSRSHPALAGVGAARLEEEIAGSKAWLEDRFGVAVTSFAYPYGSYSAAVVAATKAAGFRTARTVDDGAHETAGALATLPGDIFSAYFGRNRARA